MTTISITVCDRCACELKPFEVRYSMGFSRYEDPASTLAESVGGHKDLCEPCAEKILEAFKPKSVHAPSVVVERIKR